MTVDTGKPIIYLITRGETTDSNFATTSVEIIEIIRSAVDREISLIQIREKALSTRTLFQLAKRAAAITTGTQTKLLINDRADVALAVGADGVHLTGTSISADVIRASFPAGFLIGVSTHSVDEAIQAEKFGADFAVYGPVFATPGKNSVRGIDGLAAACSAVPGLPILGLGGVDETKVEQVMSAGAAGVAAIQWLNDSVEKSCE